MANKTELVTDKSKLIADFNRDMRWIVENESSVGYNSIRFRQMLERYEGYETAQRLLRSQPPSNTFSPLREKGRLDLTAEYYVSQEKYESLFTESEREIAAFRLRAES